MPFLQASALSKTYRNAAVPVQVFENLNLDVERGEMLAIVGPSGIGKSTLLHLIGGLDRPDAGSIRVADREVTAMSNDDLARFRNRNVGFVFQFHHLLRDFTARENVMMPWLIAGEPNAVARAKADQVLDRVVLPRAEHDRDVAGAPALNRSSSGEFTKLYVKWFENPIPPKGINIQLPMSDKLKELVKEPNDEAN